MGKYDPLSQHLSQATGPVTLTFAEIDRLVGGLPDSARNYREWWANTASNTRARAWLSAGRRVETVNLTAETVRFSSPSRSQPPGPGPAPPVHGRHHGHGSPAAVAPDVGEAPRENDVRVVATWHPAGPVRLQSGALRFPKVDPHPGVYRLMLSGPAGLSVYVGETDNLRRRMGNYRSPGPSQQTSLRIHELLRTHLAEADGRVVVEIVSDVEVVTSQQRAAADLTSKAQRVLIEHAAIHTLVASGIPVHNR
jgi:hypothetical protein